MADWSLPALSSQYILFRQAFNDRLVDAALMFDTATTSPTNLPTGTKGWNSTSGKFVKWSGSAWVDLASLYAINISGNAATATTATTANGLAPGAALANLADKSIPYAKIQDVSTTQRMLGRRSTGAGSTEEITTTQALDWIGSTRGQMLYRGSTAWTAMGVGSSGQILMSNGTDPYWGTLSLSAYATLASPAFSGVPTAPTAGTGSNNTQVATTAFVSTAVANAVGSLSGYKAVAAGYGGVGTSTITYGLTTDFTYTLGTVYALSGLSGGWVCVGRIRLDELMSTASDIRIYLFERNY